jgi:hypothetical protein
LYRYTTGAKLASRVLAEESVRAANLSRERDALRGMLADAVVGPLYMVNPVDP